MKRILCLYYSRTGMTRAAMEKIAEQLDGELVELKDGKKRGGALGFVVSGLDAMKKTPEQLLPFQTEQPLGAYDHVILGTPVWAGRCSSVVRTFLKDHGRELKNAAYVVTRSSEGKFEEVYDQMDLYVPRGHRAAVSLRADSVGYSFWQEEFLRQVREFLAAKR